MGNTESNNERDESNEYNESNESNEYNKYMQQHIIDQAQQSQEQSSTNNFVPVYEDDTKSRDTKNIMIYKNNERVCSQRKRKKKSDSQRKQLEFETRELRKREEALKKREEALKTKYMEFQQ